MRRQQLGLKRELNEPDQSEGTKGQSGRGRGRGRGKGKGRGKGAKARAPTNEPPVEGGAGDSVDPQMAACHPHQSETGGPADGGLHDAPAAAPAKRRRTKRDQTGASEAEKPKAPRKRKAAQGADAPQLSKEAQEVSDPKMPIASEGPETSTECKASPDPEASKKPKQRRKSEKPSEEEKAKPKVPKKSKCPSKSKSTGDMPEHDQLKGNTDKVDGNGSGDTGDKTGSSSATSPPMNSTWARRRRPKTEDGALKWDTLRSIFISNIRPSLSKSSTHEDFQGLNYFQSAHDSSYSLS